MKEPRLLEGWLDHSFLSNRPYFFNIETWLNHNVANCHFWCNTRRLGKEKHCAMWYLTLRLDKQVFSTTLLLILGLKRFGIMVFFKFFLHEIFKDLFPKNRKNT
jgi:hypothetical protein